MNTKLSHFSRIGMGAVAISGPAPRPRRRNEEVKATKRTLRSGKALLLPIVGLTGAVSILAACTGGGAPQALDQQALLPAAAPAGPLQAPAPTIVSYSSGDTAQTVAVPAGATSVTIKALGGGGGHGASNGNSGAGALAIGTLAVTPNEQFLVSVGGQGGSASYSGTAQGGWGGLGGNGGNGGSDSSDHLRDSGAGGGATTVQLATGPTVIVAGGGGGAGNGLPASGGNAGTSLTGSDGGEGGGYPTGPYGGKGHAAAESGPQGGAGNSGSGLGGYGAGGGGGLNGGSGGGGGGVADGGGGGGAGSSYLAPQLSATSIQAYTSNSAKLMSTTPSLPTSDMPSVQPSGAATLLTQSPSAYGNGEVEFDWVTAS